MTIFHLAYNVDNLDAARQFYGDLLGCTPGRATDTWVDYNFFGHQISLHLGTPFASEISGKVGDHLVPMPHLGVILPLQDWKALAQHLCEHNLVFELAPQIRFQDQPGEQATMFFRDPSGNPIEIKGFADLTQVFAT